MTPPGATASVYVLYTGGTIGMAGTPLAPLAPAGFAALVAGLPGFTGSSVAIQHDGGEATIDYVLDWFDEPLDSSSMTPSDWAMIAERLLQHYDRHDGFVVLHGTDTMAYTASALSFLLDGLSKTVVVTGAQIPLQHTRTDAARNLVSSIEVAARSGICESTLVFDAVVLRGNRSEKVHASGFAAFASPDFPSLGRNGISIDIDHELTLAPPEPERSLATPSVRERRRGELAGWKQRYAAFSVVTVVLYPGVRASTVRGILESTEPPVAGVLIEAFGAGNAPADPELTAVLARAHDDGVVLVDVTQVLAGSVDLDAYHSASGLKHAGAVSGRDMTPEAALTKLYYLIGRGLGQREIEASLAVDLNGEVSVPAFRPRPEPPPRVPDRRSQ